MSAEGLSEAFVRDHRSAAQLRPQLERNLLAYAGSAAAAGVSLLALVPNADGKIIYKQVHKRISVNTILPLDLNQDGVTDFTFVDSQGYISFAAWGYLTIFPNYPRNRIMGPTGTWFYQSAFALRAGKKIGSSDFSPGAKLMVGAAYAGARRRTPSATSSCFGPWKNVNDRYLGLKFRISGQVHYGWASLDVSCVDTLVTGKLTGYAYETEPNKPILSGQTQEGQAASRAEGGSLGHLARGARPLQK